MKYSKPVNERLHRHFYAFHRAITRQALPELREAILLVAQIEVKAYDSKREALRGYLAELNRLRDQTEALWQAASVMRESLIRANGCDCSCQESYETDDSEGV